MQAQTIEPVTSGTLFPGTENVSQFFIERDDQLPECKCESLCEFHEAWAALHGRDMVNRWKQAALAFSLKRCHGQRNDRRDGSTPISRFCDAVHITPAYLSRLSRTFRVFNEPVGPEKKRLLNYPGFSFKTFVVASGTPLPWVTLMEARDQNWNATELSTVLTARSKKILLDSATGSTVNPEDDDHDADVTNLPNLPEGQTKSKPPRNTQRVVLMLTSKEKAVLARRLRDLSLLMNTNTDMYTLSAIVEKAHREWYMLGTLGKVG